MANHIQFDEENFMRIIKNGDHEELQAFMKDNKRLNINCCDFKGYHALDIAALRNDKEIMSELMARSDINIDQVNSTISKLIKANQLDLLDTLLDFLDERFGESIYDEVGEVFVPCFSPTPPTPPPPNRSRGHVSPTFPTAPPSEEAEPNPPVIPLRQTKRSRSIKRSRGRGKGDQVDGPTKPPTVPIEDTLKGNPLVTAALCENAEVIHRLYRRGYRIDKPHLPSCNCSTACYDKNEKRETLSEAICRLNIYSALASPTYIILTSQDPVLSAFRLSDELKQLGKVYAEYQENYKLLEIQCRKFAAKILDLCQDTAEVETILAQQTGYNDPRYRRFPRLHLAMSYEQKNFVAHPNCQQVLRSLWADGLPKWWIWSSSRRMIHVLQHSFLAPLFICGYVFFPHPYIIRTIKVPLHRFIYASSCYAFFLSLLVWSLLITKTPYDNYELSWKDVAITTWVVAHFWEIMVNLKILGFKVCFRRWWLRCDLLMYSIFLLVQTIRYWGILTLNFSSSMASFRDQIINVLEMTDSFFAFASLVSFYRILYWYQGHPVLGTLERSLQFMIKDVTRFFALMIVAIFAFAIGLAFIYRNYTKESTSDYRQDAIDFSSLYYSLITLFWASLGKGGTTIITKNQSMNSTMIYLDSYVVNDFVGHWIWAIYHVLTGVVLLNMLIAMLAESFNRVQSDADTEWKFCRSDLWLSYFDRQSTLPPPFNVIPTLTELPQTILGFKKCLKKVQHREIESQASCWKCQLTKTDISQSKQDLAHKELVGKMVQRYLQTEETLKTIKSTQDILDRRPDDHMVKFRAEIYADIRNNLN